MIVERLSEEFVASSRVRGASAATISRRDPSSMTAEERLQEVNELFGSAYLRLLVSRKEARKEVAESREPERPCDCVVDTIENFTEEVT